MSHQRCAAEALDMLLDGLVIGRDMHARDILYHLRQLPDALDQAFPANNSAQGLARKALAIVTRGNNDGDRYGHTYPLPHLCNTDKRHEAFAIFFGDFAEPYFLGCSAAGAGAGEHNGSACRSYGAPLCR